MTNSDDTHRPATLETIDAHLETFREDVLALIAAQARDQQKQLHDIATTLHALHAVLSTIERAMRSMSYSELDREAD